jgi:polyhydroxyalkanoate synthesis regulator phasin
MAKPCRYQLPGTDTWMSESEFKKALNDGLIDKFMTENNIAVRGLKPKAVTAPVATETTVEATKTKKDLDKEFNSLNKKYVSDSKLLDEATKNNEDTAEIENRMNETQAKMGEISSQLESLSESKQETPAAPVAEVKEEGKYFIDGKEVSEEEAIKEIQDESRGYGFNLSGKKIEYQGSNEQAIRATKDHNKSISPVDNKGKLKSDYIDAAIRKAFNSVSFRKFGNAYRKHIDPYFTQSNRGQGRINKGMTWQELAGYIIGDDVNLATEEQFRAFAQELGLEVPTQETTQPVVETPAAPVAEEDNSFLYKMNTGRTSKGKGKWEDDFEIIDNKDGSTYGKDAAKWVVYNNVSGTGVDASSKKDALNIIKNAPAYGGEMWGEGTTIDFTELGEKQQNNYREEFDKQKSERQAPVAKTKAEPAQEAKVEPVAETKAPEVKQQSPIDEELDRAIIDMENIEEEIAIEKDNIREEKERIKEEKAKVRASKMSRAEKQDKLEDLDAELEDYIDNAEGTIESYKDDLKYAKAEVKKLENRKAKEATVSETKAEPTPVEPVVKEETPEYEAKEAPKKMVAPGKTKKAFDRNFTVEISADGTTATVQGEAIETDDGRKLTPPKETVKITTNINGERVAITSKGDTVYLDRAKEAEVKEVEAEGKTSQQIRDEYMEIARQSNGDYAIVYSRTNEPLVHKLNRATGRWQALNSKGEWVDANDNRNAQANDAVNYTRKDRKEVDLDGEKFYFDFKNNAWKKYSESDGSLSSISKDQASKVQKEFVKQNPKRAPKSKEEVKEVISDIIDSLRPESGIIMSSLIPGLSPKLLNKILDLVKDAMFKGVDLTFALNDAARKVFDEAVKKGEITAKQAADFIDQLNSEKVTRDGDLSSIKNDMASELAKEIASIGIENATIQEIIDSAEQAIKNGEVDPNFLVKQLIKDPRPTTPLETAVLIYSKTKMLNDLDDLYRQLNDTNPNADTSAIREKIEILESDLLQHEVATSISGSQQGLSFSLRRVMMNSEYGLFLPRIQKIYKDAGKEMPEGLKEEIEKAQKELRRLNREIETKRKQADEAKDDEAVNNIKNSNPKKGSGKKSLSKDGKVAVSIDSIRKAVSEGAKTIEEVIEAVRGEVTSTYPNATDRQIRDAISNYGREVSKTKDDLSEEVNRIRSVGRMISKLEDIQKQLATKVGKIKNEAVRTRAVKILTDRERELRRAIKEAMADIPVTEEELKAFQENKLEAYKKSLNDRNKELERRIKEGDFSTKTRTKAFELDEEARKLEIERQELIEQFEYEKMRAQLAVEPDLQKVGRRLLDVFNLPKGLIASIDLSAPFRQGVIGVMSQSPIKTARQIAQMWGFWTRPNTYDKWLSELKSSEFYPLLKASGLYVAEQNGKLSAMEEQFMNNLGNKIPILGQSYTVGGVKVPGSNLYKRSEVAYTGFLNNMRVQSFMEGADLLKEQGYTMAANPQVFKDWAKFCNSATGRGNMNPQLAIGLSPVFFSPRLIKARLEVLGLSPGYYSRMNPAARAMALKTMGRFMASTSLLIGMAALYYNNDDNDKTSVELDPRSTDFGKIKLGNTRLDITGGMAVYYRTLAQFASGQKKSTVTGRIDDLNQGFGKTTRKDVAEQFFANKLAPFPSKFYQWANLTEKEKAKRIAEEEGEDNAFNRMGIPVGVQDLVIPLWMRDVEPIMKEQGYGVGSGLIALSILGEGVQYYENKYKASKSNNSMDFNFDDSDGIGDFNDAGGIGDFNDQKGMGDFN